MTGIRERIETGYLNTKNGGSFLLELAWAIDDGSCSPTLLHSPLPRMWLFSQYVHGTNPSKRRPHTPLHEIARRILPIDFSFAQPLKITTTQTRVKVSVGLWNNTDDLYFRSEAAKRGYTVEKHTQTQHGQTLVRNYEITPPRLVMLPDPAVAMTTNYIPVQLAWILDFVSRPHKITLVKSTKRYLIVQLAECYLRSTQTPTTITWRDPGIQTSDPATAVSAIVEYMAAQHPGCEYSSSLAKQIAECVK